MKLPQIVAALAQQYGEPTLRPPSDPFAHVLWENVAYLVDDEQRAVAFAELQKHTKLHPEWIAALPAAKLAAIVALGGAVGAASRGEKLREIAELAIAKPLALHDPAPALKAIAAFPSIGKPGAEKILLFAGKLRVLALESNGLRALMRLGYGTEQRSYAATHRAVQQAAMAEVPAAWKHAELARAHLLLRHHGQTLCRRSTPQCELCPLMRGCAHAGGTS